MTHGREQSVCIKSLSHWLPAATHTPPVWREVRCGHTYLLPVAVCGERSVSSPPQCCSVVIEVTGRVHLVLHTQMKTHWLESDLGPLRTILLLVVANPEQSLAYVFKNPHTHRNPWTTSTMRDLQIMAVCTFDFSSNSLLSFYVKNKDCTFYICQILVSSIQKPTLGLGHSISEVQLGNFTLSIVSVAKQNWHWWKHYGLHVGSYFWFFLLLFIWVLWFPSMCQQLHTFITTPGKLQWGSGPLPARHVYKHLIPG